MRISYTGPRGGPDEAKGDALWIVFREDLRDNYDESEEIAEGVVAHYDREGSIISIEVYENASKKVDLSRFDMTGLSERLSEAHYA